MESKKTNIPKRRFARFSDAWEQRKLGEFAQRQSNTMFSDSENPCVEYEDVISEQGELNKDIYAKCIEKNGIIFTEEDVLYGKLRPYLHNWLNPDFKGVAVGDWWVLRPINLDKNFLYWLIQTPQYDNAANQSSGTKMPRADWKLVSNTEFYVPVSADEQAKIAGIFENLNTLITLHQRKLDKLKAMKKSYLSEMFPQPGEKKPRRRFKGFTEDWEQRKVTDLGKIFIGLVTTMTEHYTDEGALLIRNSDIKDGRFEFGDNPIYLEESFAQANSTRMHQLGDVITVHTGDVGTSAVIRENQVNSIGFATIVTRPNTKIITSDYLCTYLNTDQHKKWAVGVSTGDGRTNYNLGDYYECVVPVPKIEEQQKISEFTSDLNNLITLHQRKLDKLKNIKQAYLNEMFVK